MSVNRPRRAVCFAMLALAPAACVDLSGRGAGARRWPTQDGAPPLVIAHRGASGYRPEHTLEGYRLAIEQGADFIEPDLVSTKDGVLIARHDANLLHTTDVATRTEFAERRARKTIDGREEEGWFADDFTLAEIETLRATQRFAFRDRSFDGKFAIATLQEVLDLAAAERKRTGHAIGVYPELKHPSYHRAVGLALEPKLLAALDAHQLNRSDAPVIVQSFEPTSLMALRERSPVRLMLCLGAPSISAEGSVSYGRPYDFTLGRNAQTYGDLLTPQGLAGIKRYADGIGPAKRSLTLSEVVGDAHRAGLFVHPYTFRNEAQFVLPGYDGDAAKELAGILALGVDGVFADFADAAVHARAQIARKERLQEPRR